jgi:alpha-N-arabinofuranosidase
MRTITTLSAMALSLAVLSSASAADPVALTVRAGQPAGKIDVGIYGQFLEHIYNSVHGGLWGDQVLNGTLELAPAPRGRAGGAATQGAQASVTATPAAVRGLPRSWEFVGNAEEVRNDADYPFNAANSVRIEPKVGGDSPTGPGIRQRGIALTQGEKYTLTLYARGSGSLIVAFTSDNEPVFSKPVTGLAKEWRKFTVEFTASRTVHDTVLTIGAPPASAVNIDQVSLFSASARGNHNLRPDLYQAIADLKPASIRWPGGSFANNYVWQNGIGPEEKRIPHPVEQWNDRDNYHFGTDEFLQMCERLGAEPILVLNTGRGVPDALNWLEYCMGDESTPMGKLRAANGRAKPYTLKTLEIDNETWLMMPYERYLQVVKEFAPAIRAKYPALRLSVCGSYAFDTGPGEGNASWKNANWDPRLIADAAGLFDVLSPHYYNGLLREHAPDYKDDPRKYEEFLVERGELIKKSANPKIKIYVSEWNLTHGAWGNDWRVGLYAGGILNTFERQGDLVTMACPALFLRKTSARAWDNALVNFDQSSWFPAGNYVVMKLWRESFAPNLLAIEGTDRPLNVVASKTDDNGTLFLKVVNPDGEAHEAAFTLDGFAAGAATMQLIAPGSETAKNSLEKPDVLKAVEAPVTRSGNTVRVTMPAWSAGVIKVTR